MKQKGRYFLLFFVLLLLGTTGCQSRGKPEAGYGIYYVNKEKTRIVRTEYEPEGKNEEELVEEFLKVLRTDPGKLDFGVSLPKEIYVTKWKLENHRLYLYFTSDYLNMETAEEVLGRAAYVRTLVQIPGIESVTFYTGDTPLLDKNSKPVGYMTADSFVENPGKQINAIQIATISLYFANEDGTKLVKETQKVPYNTNISMEKFIMERLLNGPLSEDKISAIPEETKLVSISVLDGVCFVSLDEGFLSKNSNISGDLVIYSIVNSLAELSNVNKVQISVNGDTNIMYRDEFPLDTMYERNFDYVESNNK